MLSNQDQNLLYNTASATLVQNVFLDEQQIKIAKKYEFPATFKKAKLHHRAVKFGYNPSTVSKDGQGYIPSKKQLQQITPGQKRPKLCPCCNLPINTKRIPLSYNTTSPQSQMIKSHGIQRQVKFLLNSNSAMFFSFIKMAIIYLLIVFIVVDAYQLIVNILGNYCDRNVNLCEGNFFGKFSTYNLYEDTTMKGYVYTMDILCLLIVLGSIPFFIAYRKIQYQIYDKIDAENQTQDDYTILVEDIPILDFKTGSSKTNRNSIQFNYQTQLKNMMENKINSWINWIQSKNNYSFNQGTIEYDLMQKGLIQKMKRKPKVRSVSLCFDLSQLEKVQIIRQNLMQKQIEAHKDQLKSNDSYTKSNYNDDMGDIKNQIEQLNDIEVKLCQRFAQDNTPIFNITHFVGKAFVSFEYQHYCEYIIQKYQDKSQKFTYGSNQIKISRGTAPSDIFWQNMKVTDDQRKQKVISSYLIVLMAIIFAVFALVGIDLLKTDNSKSGEDLSTDTIVLNYALTIFATIVTNAINYGIGYIVQNLTSFEKHQTRTNHLTSLVVKLLISQFINNALVYYLVTVFSNRPYMTSAGLIVQVSFLIVFSGFINIVMNAVNIPYWMRKFNLWWKYRYLTFNDKKDVNIPTFQIKLNKDFELPIFDMATKYSYYLLQIYTCMFYNYLVPIGIPVTALIFGIQYWIDKTQLFYFSSQYYEMNYFLSRTILKIFEGSLLIFTIGNLIFSIVIHQYYLNALNLVSLGIALIYVSFIAFASPRLQRKVLFAKYQTFQQMSYSKAMRLQKFKNTYWTQNPGTVFIKEVDINDPKKFMKQRIANEYLDQQEVEKFIQLQGQNYNNLNQDQVGQIINEQFVQMNQDYGQDIFQYQQN